MAADVMIEKADGTVLHPADVLRLTAEKVRYD
jgi:hypothetical protein